MDREEQWQNDWVEWNLPELERTTNVQPLTSSLVSAGLLSFPEVDELERHSDMVRGGRTSVAVALYTRLMTRSNWYDTLIRVLDEHRQSGASAILIRGRDPAVRRQVREAKAREAAASTGTRETAAGEGARKEPRQVAQVGPSRRLPSPTESTSEPMEESEEYDLR